MISDVIPKGLGRDEILERLVVLSPRHRAAYALACGERMIPLYEWFQAVESWGDRGVLDKGIELRKCEQPPVIRALTGTGRMVDVHAGSGALV